VAWFVWLSGLFAYIVAVLHRTSFGVSGLEATDRFGVGPSMLSVFVVLQIVVYAGMQIPAGLLLDRWGSRKLIVSGALTMAAGSFILALTTSLPLAIAARVLVGGGDALIFISVIRLIPAWFPPRKAPLLTQLTGIIGQLGQILSAVPLLAILRGPGWATAYIVCGAVGVLAALLAIAAVRNSPVPRPQARGLNAREVGRSLKLVWLRPGTRLGFFSHMGTQFSGTVFVLLWGLPYLVSAQGLSEPKAGALLSLFVVATLVFGPFIGVLTARHPLRRSWIVLGIIASNVIMWTVVLALSQPAPYWLLALLVVCLAAGGPGSVVGFDYARTFNPSQNLGLAQGMVNQGGFLASLIVVGAVGAMLSLGGGYTFDSFRAAWLVQYPMWAIALAGVFITRRKARKVLADQGVVPRPLREVFHL
jgi:MFS family permease